MNLFDVYSLYDIEPVKGLGCHVYTADGTEYLDLYGGHAVISVGHAHPLYVSAISDQVSRLGFYSNSVQNSLQQKFADRLGRISGYDDYALFLCNSGAEANENAMKLASFHTGRKKIVAMHGAFHGRTSLAVAATDNPNITAPVNRTENVIFVTLNDEQELEKLFATQGNEIAAVILEGIQGVGGIRIASDDYLRKIRSLCDQYGALYIADSVQCGCGRTGKYYSHDWAGVNADIYTMAKGIGNGFPVAAVSIAPHIAPKYGMLGTTFGGNHLACAAALAVAEVMTEDGLVENAKKMGDYLMAELKKLPNIKEVRGKGLMIGVELNEESAPFRKRLLFDEHIFVGSSSDKNTFRLLPALNITQAHCDRLLASLRKLLA